MATVFAMARPLKDAGQTSRVGRFAAASCHGLLAEIGGRAELSVTFASVQGLLCKRRGQQVRSPLSSDMNTPFVGCALSTGPHLMVPAGRFGARDRDRGTPHGAAPPTPPGIRVTYHGGSIGLSLGGDMESRETEGVEVAVAQGVLDRRVS